MKSFLTSLLLIYCLSIDAKANYQPDDFLYVWASNGLKLRPEPSAKNQHIKIISKGSKVRIFEKTTIPHSEFLKIDKDPNNIELSFKPIEIKGYWVKIITEQKDTGYIIDNYLLDLKYTDTPNPDNIALPIRIYKSKIILQKECDGEGLCQEIHYVMDKNISCQMQYGGVWSNVTYSFPDMSLNEILIIFSCAYDNFKGLYISTFEKNKIILSDETTCEYIIDIQRIHVTLQERCSC